MKKSLLITSIVMLLGSANVFAVGSSSITGASFGGYATGDEANTAGGFCSGTGAGCSTDFVPGATTIPMIQAATVFGPNTGTAIDQAGIVTTGLGVTSRLVALAATAGSVLATNTALEAASGAGVNSASNLLQDIDPVTATTAGPPPTYGQGTYTGMQALSVGAYTSTTPNDPTVAGNTTGNVNALQKPDLGYAQTNNATTSTASAYKGQAVTYSGIAGVSQAVNANY